MGFRFRCVAVLVLVVVAAGLRAEEPAALWWSFQPIVRPQPPAGPQIRNEIDRFILAKLKDEGAIILARGRPPDADPPRDVRPHRPAADARGGRRRSSPTSRPTPTRSSSIACSPRPRYGERWRRHWMDVVHFAETHGHDQDRVRPNAWPYRDYLIDVVQRATRRTPASSRSRSPPTCSFPTSRSSSPALGFLAAGPWDESSLRDIREDTIDREVGRYLDRDDIVTTVMSTRSRG